MWNAPLFTRAKQRAMRRICIIDGVGNPASSSLGCPLYPSRPLSGKVDALNGVSLHMHSSALTLQVHISPSLSLCFYLSLLAFGPEPADVSLSCTLCAKSVCPLEMEQLKRRSRRPKCF